MTRRRKTRKSRPPKRRESRKKKTAKVSSSRCKRKVRTCLSASVSSFASSEPSFVATSSSFSMKQLQTLTSSPKRPSKRSFRRSSRVQLCSPLLIVSTRSSIVTRSCSSTRALSSSTTLLRSSWPTPTPPSPSLPRRRSARRTKRRAKSETMCYHDIQCKHRVSYVFCSSL